MTRDKIQRFLAIFLTIVVIVDICILVGHTEFLFPKKVEEVEISSESEEISIVETEAETETEVETEIETEIETEVETTAETTAEMSSRPDPMVEEKPITEAPTEATSAANPQSSQSHFHYYGIYSGAYWHFTPEQIDNQWAGQKISKPILPTGTTRAWQKYLYEKLAERGLEWFYPYAVAQAMQESGFNPLNQQGNNAIPDKGLYSFRIYYWNAAYGDIYDYHANIDAYVDRISRYLTDSSENTIYMALSQHYNPTGQIHMNYVNYVLGRLNELWICD